jgi:predicted nucleic acid-binding protein
MIFSNTTPFIALASIDQLQLLPQLFGEIYVAQSVVEECAEGGSILVPALQTLSWVMVLPDESNSNLPVLFELDRGEKQTLLIASKHPGSTVIIDERLGRNAAEYLGLQVTGTLGVLAKAKSSGLIPSFTVAAQAMRDQGIHYSEGLITRLAQHLGEAAL